jgi:predicted GH43/DUF377 family glycosyl hydrolase
MKFASRFVRAWVALAVMAWGASAALAEPAATDFPRIVITDRTTEPLLKAEKPWESFAIGFVRVIRVGDAWHMWYVAFDAATYRSDTDYTVCYAKSADGVHWERPSLGLVEYNGSKDNNIIARNDLGSGVFLDPSAPPAERFKCVFGRVIETSWCMFGGVSPDGIHWAQKPGLLLRRNTDTDNVCFYDESARRYRFYIRMWTGTDPKARRLVGYLESPTFAGPLDPNARRVVLAPDDADPKDLHFYNSAASKLGESLYVMFPSGYTKGDDLVRPHLALSRDGVTWHRIGRGPVLELGKTFDGCGLYVAPAPVPADKPGEFWFYYTGTDVPHDQNMPGKVHFSGGVGRFRVKLVDAAR